MTDDCFENFVTRAAAAVKEGNELDSTLPNSLASWLLSQRYVMYCNPLFRLTLKIGGGLKERRRLYELLRPK